MNVDINHDHAPGEPHDGCAACRDGIEAVHRRQNEMLAKHGWYSHVVPSEDEQTPFGFNAHTHSLPESFNHPDFQVVLPLAPDVAHRVLASAVEQVKKGHRFDGGGDHDDVLLQGYKVRAVWAAEGGRDVVRLILPNLNRALDRAEMTDAFERQYEGTVE